MQGGDSTDKISTTKTDTSTNSNNSNAIFQNEEKSSSTKRGIIGVISEIQHYAVLEQKTQNEVSSDFFSLSQKLEYFRVSFMTGVYEGLFFMFVFPILLLIVPCYLAYFYGIEFSMFTIVFLNIFSYLSLGILTIVFLYFAKYYSAGVLTRTALNYVFFGRGSALLLKAGLSYLIFTWLHKISYISPNTVYAAGSVFNAISKIINLVLQKVFNMNIVDANFTNEQYYQFYFKAVVPILEKTGYEMSISLLLAGISPFLLVLFLIKTGSKGDKNKKILEKY